MSPERLAEVERLCNESTCGKWSMIESERLRDLLTHIRELEAIRDAAARVRDERKAFLAKTAGRSCERSLSLEAAEAKLDALLDAKTRVEDGSGDGTA